MTLHKPNASNDRQGAALAGVDLDTMRVVVERCYVV